ncbi:MAG: hypothetical protein WKF77_22985 [Planctomycetaceae bacterium]
MTVCGDDFEDQWKMKAAKADGFLPLVFFVMTADLDSRSPIDSLVQDDG